MNIFRIIISMLATMAFGLALTSCDTDINLIDADDEAESRVLCGEWRGFFRSPYSYECDGHIVTIYACETVFHFEPECHGSCWGTGTQEDYFDLDAPIRSTTYEFIWQITDGIIELEYPTCRERNTSFSRYHITNNDMTSSKKDTCPTFSLSKTSDFYSHTPCFNYRRR